MDLHDTSGVYEFLKGMATNEDFKDKVIDLKNSYYSNFSDWDELNYMQFLITNDIKNKKL